MPLRVKTIFIRAHFQHSLPRILYSHKFNLKDAQRFRTSMVFMNRLVAFIRLAEPIPSRVMRIEVDVVFLGGRGLARYLR